MSSQNHALTMLGWKYANTAQNIEHETSCASVTTDGMGMYSTASLLTMSMSEEHAEYAVRITTC